MANFNKTGRIIACIIISLLIFTSSTVLAMNNDMELVPSENYVSEELVEPHIDNHTHNETPAIVPDKHEYSNGSESIEKAGSDFVGGHVVQINGDNQLVDSISFNGNTVNAYYRPYQSANDTDSYYSCAALVKRVYQAFYGVTPYNMLGTNHIPLVDGGSFTATSSPQIGDIVRDNWSTHWAIVKTVSGDTVTVIQQNYYSSGGAWVGATTSINNDRYTFFRYSKASPDPGGGHTHAFTRKILNDSHEEAGHRVLLFCENCNEYQITEEWSSKSDCSICNPPSAESPSTATFRSNNGETAIKGRGFYKNPAEIGLLNDSITYIKVGSESKVAAYENDNFDGQRWIFEKGEYDLDLSTRNKISSFVVMDKNDSNDLKPTPDPDSSHIHNFTNKCLNDFHEDGLGHRIYYFCDSCEEYQIEENFEVKDGCPLCNPDSGHTHYFTKKVLNDSHEEAGHRVLLFCENCNECQITEKWEPKADCVTCFPDIVHTHSYTTRILNDFHEEEQGHRVLLVCSDCGDHQPTEIWELKTDCLTCYPNFSHTHSFLRKILNYGHEEQGHRVLLFCFSCDEHQSTDNWETKVDCDKCFEEDHTHSYTTRIVNDTHEVDGHRVWMVCECGEYKLTENLESKIDCDKCSGVSTIGKVENLNIKSASYNSIKLTWNIVNDADGYYVYRKDNTTGQYKSIKKIVGSSKLNFTDKNLTTSNVYYYRVLAYKTDGENLLRSAPSTTVKAKPLLSKVTNFKVKGHNGAKIRLTWNQSAGASGYMIYRSTAKASGYKQIKTVGKLSSFTDSKLTVGKTYYYKVIPYRNINGNRVKGVTSNMVSAQARK